MRKIDVVIMISEPDDGGDILVVNSSASEEIGVPPLQTSIADELSRYLSDGFQIDSTKAIGENKVQYTLIRVRRQCCDNECHPWR